MKREGRLPNPRLIHVFRQILEGLRAAHDQGVVHRDLKPQNIMLDASDNVFVTDFGLAKSIEQSGMTQTGAIVGTPYYMSPEQVKGAKIDHRSDIYSVGVILYEMSTARLPFTGSTPYEVMAQRLQRAPQPAGELNPDLPAYLRKILERCMAKDPDTRYASVEEILRDLDSGSFRTTLRWEAQRRRWLRPALGAALGVAVLAGAGVWLSRRTAPVGTGPRSAEAAVPVLGVVPFENRTGNAALDWYGEGVGRLVADGLAQSRHLRVVSMDRTLALRRGNADRAALQKAAAAAGIQYLLTGDILPGPAGLTVSTRLSDTRDGHELASGRVDKLAPATLVGAADRIALVAKKGLGLPPTEGVDAYGADFVSKNPEAYESYVEGLHAVNEYRYARAQAAFERALSKAPDYAMARYWLATVKAASGRTEEALADLKPVVAQASRLPDREARYVRAAEAYFARRYDDAIKMYRDLIQRYPYEIEARRILLLRPARHQPAEGGGRRGAGARQGRAGEPRRLEHPGHGAPRAEGLQSGRRGLSEVRCAGARERQRSSPSRRRLPLAGRARPRGAGVREGARSRPELPLRHGRAGVRGHAARTAGGRVRAPGRPGLRRQGPAGPPDRRRLRPGGRRTGGREVPGFGPCARDARGAHRPGEGPRGAGVCPNAARPWRSSGKRVRPGG